MKLMGLDHIQLAIPAGGEAEARHFYGELLGLTEIPKPEPLVGRGGCWFEGPTITLHLGVQADFIPARKAHPAFLVEDLAALGDHLEAVGIAVSMDDTLPDTRRFHALDPFGNRLEFIQNGEGFSQS